jgi:hypothetical protein
MAERSRRDEIPPGTLYLLILQTLLRRGEMHGYEIANAIQQVSEDVLQVEEGSLYSALQRMLLKGDRPLGRHSGQSAGPLLPAHRSRPQTVSC